MAYNYNPNFSKHMELNKSNIKFLKQLRNNDNFNYKPTSIKMKNFVNNELEEIQKYKIADIDNPNGWSFNELTCNERKPRGALQRTVALFGLGAPAPVKTVALAVGTLIETGVLELKFNLTELIVTILLLNFEGLDVNCTSLIVKL